MRWPTLTNVLALFAGCLLAAAVASCDGSGSEDARSFSGYGGADSDVAPSDTAGEGDSGEESRDTQLDSAGATDGTDGEPVDSGDPTPDSGTDTSDGGGMGGYDTAPPVDTRPPDADLSGACCDFDGCRQASGPDDCPGLQFPGRSCDQVTCGADF